MEIHLLGPLRVVADDGTDATPRAAQQRRVLAALAVSSPKFVAIGDLEDVLWPNGAPSANALQALMSKLRKIVAPATIETDGRAYALAGPFVTDIAEFRRLADAGSFAAAEALVRGVPLADIADEPLGSADSARLASEVGAVRAKRLEQIVHGVAPADAIGDLQALVRTEPLDESWWAMLMVAQYRSGQQVEALRTFQRARDALADVGLEPGPLLQETEQRLLAHDSILAVVAPPAALDQPRQSRVPARLTSFVGRTAELAELDGLVSEHRLVTLLGPGGVGKTTISLEIARRAPHARVSVAEMSTLNDRDAIVRAIMRATGLPDGSPAGFGGVGVYDDPLDRLIDGLRDAHALIVVDNCEHARADIADIVHRVLAECAHVSVLATSREPLAVLGEFVYPLPPLPSDDAVVLFADRARAAGATAALEAAPERAIHELCQRLDGLPLAIELAAARVRTMSVNELLARLDDRFTVLASAPKGVDARQQTLRAVVDWSHDLLDPAERIVFRRLAAFVGDATPDAARAVCAGAPPAGRAEPDIAHDEVGDIIDRLVDKSLVVVSHRTDGARFSMLETLRVYATQRLAESGENERVLTRHAQHFADAVQPAMRGLTGPDQPFWIDYLRCERDNVEAALDTAVARGDAQLAIEIVAPIGWYFFMSGELEAGRAMLGAALACDGLTEPALRAVTLGVYGWLVVNGAQLEHAVAVTSEAMSLVDRIDDAWMRALVAATDVMANFFAGHLDTVETLQVGLRKLADEAEDSWATGIADVIDGEIAQLRSGAGQAEAAFERATTSFAAAGDQFLYALTLTEAAEIAEWRGDYDRAVGMLERAMSIAERIGFSVHPMAMRSRLGNLEILRGNLDVAHDHHRSLIDDPATAGVPWLHSMSRIGLAAIARRRGDFDAAAEHLDAAWALPRTQSVPYMRSLNLVAKGYLADQVGDADAAWAHQRRALNTARQLGTPRGIAYALEGCAGALAVTSAADRQELGARLLGHADRMRRDVGGAMPPGERFDVDRAESRLRAALGEDAFATAFASGAAAVTDDLVAAIEAID